MENLVEKVQEKSLPGALKQDFDSYQLLVGNYKALQGQFLQTVEESARLTKRSAQLDEQARRTDESLHAMATTTAADQEKINDEIGRAGSLRDEARQLRVTVESRKVVLDRLRVELAESRLALVKEPTSLNQTYHQWLLNDLLRSEGARDFLLELFVLSRELHQRNVQDSRMSSTQTIPDGAWLLLGREVEKVLAGDESKARAPFLAGVPPVVDGEPVVRSPAELMRLKRSAGL